MASETVDRLTEAARTCLLAEGYANLSTRRVAEQAGVPLSQIHYHFGGKQGLVLALLAAENRRLVGRQEDMYAGDLPLSARYDRACDYLEDDLASGYVRVLQEMIAAGWSDAVIAERVREMLQGWLEVVTQVAHEAEARLGPLGPFPAEELGALVGQAFMGGEAMLLLGFDRRQWPVRSALRRVALVIRALEEGHRR
jgi:AcrR family transcriptional regulator